MTTYFFDSSALLKRYIREAGSNWTLKITDPNEKHDIVISQITIVEVNSGFARKKRDGFLQKTQQRQ